MLWSIAETRGIKTAKATISEFTYCSRAKKSPFVGAVGAR
jgi:hypothetical protein